MSYFSEEELKNEYGWLDKEFKKSLNYFKEQFPDFVATKETLKAFRFFFEEGHLNGYSEGYDECTHNMEEDDDWEDWK